MGLGATGPLLSLLGLNEITVVDFFDIAEWTKEAAAQEAVYLRLPNGMVFFV